VDRITARVYKLTDVLMEGNIVGKLAVMHTTLLIPVYNKQEGLERTCASLSSDTDCHVVIVDDGSHPPVSLPPSLDPQRVTLLRLAKNQGITRALNHGLEWILRNGYRYVARLDAGDVMLAGRLARQMEFLESHPDYAIVGGQARFVDMQGRESFRDNFPTTDAAIRRAMHGRSCFIHPAVMLRVAMLRAVGPYDERYPSAEDFELFWRLMKTWKGANLADPIVEYVLDPRGISLSKRSQQVRSRIRILLAYFDLWAWESYTGLVKNLVLLAVPYRWVRWVKRRHIPSHRGWL